MIYFILHNLFLQYGQHITEVILAIQEPFQEELTQLQEELTNVQKDDLNKVLRRFDLDNLLGILYELIKSRLRFSSQEELFLS